MIRWIIAAYEWFDNHTILVLIIGIVLMAIACRTYVAIDERNERRRLEREVK